MAKRVGYLQAKQLDTSAIQVDVSHSVCLSSYDGQLHRGDAESSWNNLNDSHQTDNYSERSEARRLVPVDLSMEVG